MSFPKEKQDGWDLGLSFLGSWSATVFVCIETQANVIKSDADFFLHVTDDASKEAFFQLYGWFAENLTDPTCPIWFGFRNALYVYIWQCVKHCKAQNFEPTRATETVFRDIGGSDLSGPVFTALNLGVAIYVLAQARDYFDARFSDASLDILDVMVLCCIAALLLHCQEGLNTPKLQDLKKPLCHAL